MKISLVIPNFNDARIDRTLAMFVNQDYNDYEIIVVEGCLNNDKTAPVYEKYKSNISKLIHEKDRGIFDALNKGIQAAEGEYIMLIGSDDRISHNDIFSKVSQYFGDGVDGVCLECLFVNEEDKVVRTWKPKSISKSKIKWGILPPHFSLFLHKSVYEQLGLFELSKEALGIDSRWLLNLYKIKNLNIPVIKDRATLMQLGGVSTVSVPNILKGNINMMYEARQLGLWNWPLIPLIKLLSKIPQSFKS
tara:strand:- start:376 stop:1119 length:744 start_codon:yes stop_codon:yes gene_type:complete